MDKITVLIKSADGRDLFEGDLKDLLTLENEGAAVLPLSNFVEIWVDGEFYADVDYLRGR